MNGHHGPILVVKGNAAPPKRNAETMTENTATVKYVGSITGLNGVSGQIVALCPYMAGRLHVRLVSGEDLYRVRPESLKTL
jgi:hypothetical protein